MGTVLILAAFASPAFANSPTWLSPVSLSASGQNAASPVVAMDGNGDTQAAWVAPDGNTANPAFQGVLRTAGPGNAFGAVQTVSDDSQVASSPQVGEDQNGNAEGIWVQNGEIWGSWSTNDGINYGSPPGTEIDSPNTGESDPRIAVDPNGNVIAVWVWNDGTNNVIRAAFAPTGSAGTFGTPVTLSNDTFPSSNPQIAEDPNGDAIVVWQQSNGTNLETQYAYRPQGSATSWTGAQEVDTESGDETSPVVAMDGNGNATVAWVFNDGTNEIIQEALGTPSELSGGQVFNAQQNLTTDSGNASNPAIADDGNGDTAVVWALGGDAQAAVEASGSSSFSSNATLGPVDAGSQPQVAITAKNAVLAVWQESDKIEAETGGTGGSFSGTTQISGSNATEPELAVDGNGNAVAAWLQENGSSHEIATAAGYDGTGPIGAAHFHEAGVAGQALTFYAKASDVWPAISYSWNFGDGGTATGANVIHAFAHTGNYTVTEQATASDGNTATSTQNINVAASAPAAPVGGLSQPASPSDCVTSASYGCGTLIPYGLNSAYQPAVSPDGKSVYEVGLFGGIVEFSRNPATGALTEIGCVTGDATDCPGAGSIENAEGISNPAGIAVSPDGSTVYVIDQGDNSIATFTRNASTGLLAEQNSSCFSANSIPGCTSDVGLDNPYGIAVSPDGKNVYVSTYNGQDIAEFARNATSGALSLIPGNTCIADAASSSGCPVTTSAQLLHLVGVAAYGSNVYGVAGATNGDGDIAEFARNASNGALSTIAGNPCIGSTASGCPRSATDINGTEDMAIAPNGAFAYVNSFSNDAVVELSRNAITGALAQIGCVGTSSSPLGCAPPATPSGSTAHSGSRSARTA